MAAKQNTTGPQVAELRRKRGMTQEQFAARCSKLGLELSRVTLSKIESQLRCITDTELLALAEALNVSPGAFFRGVKLKTSPSQRRKLRALEKKLLARRKRRQL
ncbi:MAG: helix-turn-helix transcriptional regulator [Verrucomicrobia bacterium]|nr:helix-turn-helix transcriptional regulator [Verrucomicrobiota bacterium]